MSNYKNNRIEHLENYYKTNYKDIFKPIEKHPYIFRPTNNFEDMENLLIVKDIQPYQDVQFEYKISKNGNFSSPKVTFKNINAKLDYRCNNLTSSSVVSVNFLLYLFSQQEIFKKFIVDNLNIKVNSDDVNVEFEKINEADSSHIDVLFSFTSEDNKKINVYTEVKYCESAYGKKTKNQKQSKSSYVKTIVRQYKFHSKYLDIKGWLDVNGNFEDCYNSLYSKYFQVIRNVWHAFDSDGDSENHTLFIYPKKNVEAAKDIDNSLGFISLKGNNKDIISKRVHQVAFEDCFENLISKDSELYKRYFDE